MARIQVVITGNWHYSNVLDDIILDSEDWTYGLLGVETPWDTPHDNWPETDDEALVIDDLARRAGYLEDEDWRWL